MEERTIGLDAARRVLGDLAADTARGVVTILTSHRHPLAQIVPLGTYDERWNEAVDWLLNSPYTAEPEIQTAFRGIAEGKCTRVNVAKFVHEELYGSEEGRSR